MRKRESQRGSACKADGSSGRAQDGLCEEIDELGSTPVMAVVVLGGGAGARRAYAAAAARGLEMPISPSMVFAPRGLRQRHLPRWLNERS